MGLVKYDLVQIVDTVYVLSKQLTPYGIND